MALAQLKAGSVLQNSVFVYDVGATMLNLLEEQCIPVKNKNNSTQGLSKKEGDALAQVTADSPPTRKNEVSQPVEHVDKITHRRSHP